MREPDDRLAGLESYQALPLPLRRAVRLHLVHKVPVSEAMRLAGRERNVKRDWSQPAVQQVLTDYLTDGRDYVAALAELTEPDLSESATYETPKIARIVYRPSCPVS